MKHVFRLLTVLLFTAAVAAWLKMLLPHLSIGYWPLWKDQSLRNRIGMMAAMPLYEILYLGYAYLVSIIIYGMLFHKQKLAARNPVTALLLGIIVASSAYLIYQVIFYLHAAKTYELLNGHGGRPWFSWVSYPEDLELLVIYALVGLSGGWLYYKLNNQRNASMDT